MKFTVDGPSHLVESGKLWSDDNSLRAAMACLVQAVYALDRDMGPGQVSEDAPGWHKPFKYKLVKVLHEEEGSDQIVGAVFKWSRRLSLLRAAVAPKVVVALRGTMPHLRDLEADLRVFRLQGEKSPRFSVAFEEVKQAVKRYGQEKVCMAGHSLGAAVCLLVGRKLAEEESCFIDAHLFNPPCPSLDMLDNLKGLAAAVVAAFSDNQQQAPLHLKDWCPHLYVNAHDPICAAYVDYFRNVDDCILQANSNDAGRRPSRVAGNIRRLIQWLLRGKAKPYHLIPSARLHSVAPQGFMTDHTVAQWWSQDAQIHSLLVGFASYCST